MPMGTNENVEVVREVFRAIENRDGARLGALLDPEVEFLWAPSLPYGANVHERPTDGPTWAGTWIPLQPTDAEQRMDMRVVAASNDEVVALWRQKGITPEGHRFDGEVLALYRVRNGKLARAQMFHFDSAEVAAFLARAAG
jgi:ketosteroid isomerase-like protein